MSYIPATAEQREEMLRACGVPSVRELFADIPDALAPPDDEFFETEGISEIEALAWCEELAAENGSHLVSFLGGGFYDHFIPAAVDAIVGRSEFYTAYTPYQPELSQGTLQAIYEYQTHICRLTGMEISNASLYDGGTAIFEACKMAAPAGPRFKIVVDEGVNPIYRKMLRTHTANLDIGIIETPILADGNLDRSKICGVIDEGVAAVVLQNPNFYGVIDDHSDIVDVCKKFGVTTVQSVHPIALSLLKTPAEQGFDIAVGEGQPLGIPLSFGGPYLGFMGARKELARRMPGRIAARTEDVNGRPGFVLSLQTREQHIRREKATSNICSNEALCALRAHAYLSLLGKEGLTEVASLCHSKAMYMRKHIGLMIPSIKLSAAPVFNEFVIELPVSAEECVTRMASWHGFAAGIPIGENRLLVAVTEKRTKSEIDFYIRCLEDAVSRE